jgi:hypothetical protein
LEGVSYEIPEGEGEPCRSFDGGRDRERGSNRATGEGYREGLRLGGDPIRAEGEGERVSNLKEWVEDRQENGDDGTGYNDYTQGEGEE